MAESIGQNDSHNGASSTGRPSQPACYLIVHNVSKRHNIGNLLRNAAAFGVAEVCLVGSRHYATFGSHGSADYLSYKHFATLLECCAYLQHQKGCEILGLEITAGAQPVQQHPFHGPTAFMLGNEGLGLSEKQVAACDHFVYIPQHGGGTASLNVATAAAIALHHFAIWAGFEERPRTGGKFDVALRPLRDAPRGRVPLSAEEAAQRKQDRAAAASQDWTQDWSFDGRDPNHLPDSDDGEGGVPNFAVGINGAVCDAELL